MDGLLCGTHNKILESVAVMLWILDEWICGIPAPKKNPKIIKKIKQRSGEVWKTGNVVREINAYLFFNLIYKGGVEKYFGRTFEDFLAIKTKTKRRRFTAIG